MFDARLDGNGRASRFAAQTPLPVDDFTLQGLGRFQFTALLKLGGILSHGLEPGRHFVSLPASCLRCQSRHDNNAKNSDAADDGTDDNRFEKSFHRSSPLVLD
jgi:hypothetical protein